MSRQLAWIPWWGRGAICTTALVALLAGNAHAKPWSKWAPSPLASDSSYAALSARPADSLGIDEFAWVEVQRDWRAQRNAEISGASRSSLTNYGRPHHVRSSDGRFAVLLSQPYEALTAPELAWLIAENGARQRGESGPGLGGILLVIGIAGVVATIAAILTLQHAFDSVSIPL